MREIELIQAIVAGIYLTLICGWIGIQCVKLIRKIIRDIKNNKKAD